MRNLSHSEGPSQGLCHLVSRLPKPSASPSTKSLSRCLYNANLLPRLQAWMLPSAALRMPAARPAGGGRQTKGLCRAEKHFRLPEGFATKPGRPGPRGRLRGLASISEGAGPPAVEGQRRQSRIFCGLCSCRAGKLILLDPCVRADSA